MYTKKKKGVSQVAKVRVNISVDEDTIERLKQYAYENHTTVSQVITDMAWKLKVKNEQLRGQQSLDFKK